MKKCPDCPKAEIPHVASACVSSVSSVVAMGSCEKISRLGGVEDVSEEKRRERQISGEFGGLSTRSWTTFPVARWTTMTWTGSLMGKGLCVMGGHLLPCCP